MARTVGLALAGALVASLGVAAQTPRADPLSRARQFYNDQQYDAAIQAAAEARLVPALANAATVVFARAHLDRFGQTQVQSDLPLAREALKQVDESRLTPRDQIDFLVGLGQSFFLEGCLDGCYAAAAEQFAQALARADAAGVNLDSRELLFEWWAATLDKRAQLGPALARRPIYARVIERAEQEIARPETSAVGLYWLAAAARGSDDLERAWGAATSGWARARYLGSRGEQLRAGLDRFVTLVLLPERARELASTGDPRAALASLEAQWDDWKIKWK